MDFSWPYRFIWTLSEEEKLRRRELLDRRGAYAQWSIIAMILVLRLYQGWAESAATLSTSKPRRGPASWWDRPLVVGWLETRRQYALCGLWLLWLFSLSVWQSGDGMSSCVRFYCHDRFDER